MSRIVVTAAAGAGVVVADPVQGEVGAGFGGGDLAQGGQGGQGGRGGRAVDDGWLVA